MLYKLLACKIMTREVSNLLWRCPNSIDLTLMTQKLHDRPEQLREALQQEIDMIDANADMHTNDLEKHDIDAILLGYGLCSNAVVGLRSKRYPLVIPRIHDCLSLLFGKRERFSEYAAKYPGTFYYTQSWCDMAPFSTPEQREAKRAAYMEEYDDDEETVEYLMSVEDEMFRNYDRVAYISWPELLREDEIDGARKLAADKNWAYDQVAGENSLLEDFLWGRWDEQHFLVIPPGKTIAASYDDNVLEYE